MIILRFNNLRPSSSNYNKRAALLLALLAPILLLCGCNNKPEVSEATKESVRAYEQTKPSDTSREARLQGYNKAHGSDVKSSATP